jgi:hypothetical protein
MQPLLALAGLAIFDFSYAQDSASDRGKSPTTADDKAQPTSEPVTITVTAGKESELLIDVA